MQRKVPTVFLNSICRLSAAFIRSRADCCDKNWRMSVSGVPAGAAEPFITDALMIAQKFHQHFVLRAEKSIRVIQFVSVIKFNLELIRTGKARRLRMN